MPRPFELVTMLSEVSTGELFNSIPPLPDTFVGERNFCQLDFSGPAKARRLSISVFDVNGKQRWQREISASELRPDD